MIARMTPDEGVFTEHERVVVIGLYGIVVELRAHSHRLAVVLDYALRDDAMTKMLHTILIEILQFPFLQKVGVLLNPYLNE